MIGIDGLAIIVNAANPLDELTTDTLAKIFSGEVKTWEEIGGRGGAIRLYSRDDNSGTFDTFKELVLASHGKALASGVQRFESSDQLSAEVSKDPQALASSACRPSRMPRRCALPTATPRPCRHRQR